MGIRRIVCELRRVGFLDRGGKVTSGYGRAALIKPTGIHFIKERVRGDLLYGAGS